MMRRGWRLRACRERSGEERSGPGAESAGPVHCARTRLSPRPVHSDNFFKDSPSHLNPVAYT